MSGLSKTETYLFIGGPADGKRYQCYGKPQVKTADMIGSLTAREHIYTARELRVNDEQLFIFVHSMMSTEDAFQKLIQFYWSWNGEKTA